MKAITQPLITVPHRTGALSERHVMVFTAALFVVLTLAGFVPTSLEKVQAVQNGMRPPFPLALHVHAVLMGAWLLLLLAQSLLSAGNRYVLHRRLGYLGASLLPAIVISGIALVDATWQGLWSPAAEAMPAAVLQETRTFVSNILLLQIRGLGSFVAFIGWGLWLRRRDSQAHRRLMLLGTAVPLVAGLERLTTTLGWTTMPASPLSLEGFMLLAVLPLLAWDLLHLRRLHYTTRVWLFTNLLMATVMTLLWNTPTWLALAPRLYGV